MYKPTYLVIEGVDRVGKTRLQRTLDKMTNYRNITTIRGPIGFLTYNDVYKKGVPTNFYYDIERMILKVNHLVIYLYASIKVLEERAKRERARRFSEKKPLFKKGTWNFHLLTYEHYYKISKLNKMKFDTSIFLPEEIAEIIIKELEMRYPMKEK